MARIPMGDFGNVVARPVERPSGGPDAYGVGRAVEQAGNIGMRVAGQEIDQANAEADRAKRQADMEAKQAQREAAAEAKAEQRRADAEAQAAAREAARVKALTAIATITNGLNDLHDEIQTGLADGTVDKGKALETFQTRAAKLQSSGIEGVDPENRPLVEASLLDNVGRARRSVGQLVAAREKADIMSGGLAYFEEMQRYAVRGPKEADQAIANVRTFWTTTGPMAGEKDPQARVQAFAEKVRFTQATALVNADPAAAMKALKDPKYLPELDPGARTNLIHTADARVTQAANRAEVAAQASARRLNQEWGAVMSVYEAGKALSPEYLEQKRKQFKGTPFAGALEQMAAASPTLTAFASQPLPAQEASLMALQQRMNSGGATPAQIEEYQRREKAFKANAAAASADPYMAYAEVGGIGANDLAPLQIDMQTIGAQLERRREVASRVSQWVGQDVSLFRPAEAAKVSNLLAAMPPKDKAAALNGLSKVMTPGQRRAFSAQIDDGKDRGLALSMRYTGDMTSPALNTWGKPIGDPRLVSEMILKGAQAMKDGTSTKGSGAAAAEAPTAWRAYAARELADVFPNQQDANDIRDAAERIMHGFAAEAGGKLDSDDMERAVRWAVGGSMVEHNGRKIPLPAGVDENALAKRLRAITPGDLTSQTPGGVVRAGGVQVPVADFVKTIPAQPLMPVTKGRYNVLVGGRPATNATGEPILIEVK